MGRVLNSGVMHTTTSHPAFSLGQPTYDPFTVVTVLNRDRRVMGMAVDSVLDVVLLDHKADQVGAGDGLGDGQRPPDRARNAR